MSETTILALIRPGSHGKWGSVMVERTGEEGGGGSVK